MINKPKTVKGYISLIERASKIGIDDLKDFENLGEELKTEIKFLMGELCNYIGTIKDLTNE